MTKKKGILFPYIWKYKVHYAIGLLTLLFVDYMNLYVPQITGEITDGLTSHALDLDGIFKLIINLMTCVLLIALGRVCWRTFILGASRKVETEIRNDMFSKLETLSQNYFNKHKTGDLMTHFTNDLDALRNSIGFAVVSAFDAVVMTIMVIYKMMAYVDVGLTLMTLIPMGIIAAGSIYFMDQFELKFANKQKAFANMSDLVQESITGERVIKAFVQENNQDKAFEKVNIENKKANMDVVKLMALVGPLLGFIVGLGYTIAIIYGGYLAITAQITLGRFVAFNSYLGMLVWPMIALGDSVTTFSQGKAAIGRIGQIFNEIPEIQDDNCLDIDKLNGNISIQNLTFSYGKEFPNALEDLTIHIKQGETLAILGRTGEGKTTLVNLLLRIYDINQGSIQFDNHDIKQIPLKTLRSNIAYVPQDSFLFSDTLENNIKFGKNDATHEEIIQVCKDACVHDNIIDFPEQYETIVGERGVTLSGGQKQRCAIARALLKDAPILILDDSLSAVDTDTEDQILDNLKQKRQNKTTIMIAHRISTVKNADHILVLEDGKKAEYGTFEELMEINGIFKEMYDKQQLEKQLSAS